MESRSLAGLQYRLSTITDSKAPLCLMLHGRSGDLNSMAVFNRCLPPHFNVVCAQAPLADIDGGYSWWAGADERSFTDKAEQAAVQVREFLYQVIRAHDLFPALQMGCGFSQGAAVLSYLAQKNPRLFDSLALLSGFVVRLDAEQSKRICGGKDRSRIFMAHGAGDETIPVDRARDDVQHLRSLGYDVVYVEEAGGHKAGIQSTRALKIWVEGEMSRLT